MVNMMPPEDFEAWMRDKNKRQVQLERRGLPARVSSTGQGVTDWNDAVMSGWYWSEADALNNPVGNIAVGQVLVKPSGAFPRVLQIVYFPSETESARRREYRRVKNLDTGIWSSWAVINEDTGWISGVVTAATGWSLVSQSFRKIDNVVIVRYLEVQRTGGAINGAAGDIANSTIATITDSRFTPAQNMGGLSSAAAGRLAAVTASATGSFVLTAVAAGLTDNTGVLPNSTNWSVSGWYRTD